MTDLVLVYMTMASREQAEQIGKALVQERLAACVNIGAAVHSLFHWDGQLSSETEVPVLAKTRADRFDALARRVAELHSYECPCVVAVPIQQVYGPFLGWVTDQVSSEPEA